MGVMCGGDEGSGELLVHRLCEFLSFDSKACGMGWDGMGWDG